MCISFLLENQIRKKLIYIFFSKIYIKESTNMKCSICRQEGHNKRGCKMKPPVIIENDITAVLKGIIDKVVSNTPKHISHLKTEDTGKIFEKAICDVYGIPFDGPFKYSQEEANHLVPRLKKLVSDNLFPQCSHTASKGARYDFTSIDGTQHLSAKSNKKKGGKIAPQVVGQAHPIKFCKIMGIEYTSPEQLKQYIQEHIVDSVLPLLWAHTFDCPILYYLKETGEISFITPLCDGAVNWSQYQYNWTCSYDNWKNSSTLKIIIDGKEEAILEFQIHSKNRQNMAIRWITENVLQLFKNQFSIITL
jgi:hypothetical protein